MDKEKDCTQTRVTLCGEIYDMVVTYQAQYKMKYKRNCSIPLAVTSLIRVTKNIDK